MRTCAKSEPVAPGCPSFVRVPCSRSREHGHDKRGHGAGPIPIALAALVGCAMMGTAAAQYPNTGATPYPQAPVFAPPVVQSGPAQPARTSPAAVPIEGGEIIARVGGAVILAADVLPFINETLEKNKEQVERAPPEELQKFRKMLMRRQLDQLVETKLLWEDARRSIPAENLPNIEARLVERFDEVQLPKLYKRTETSTLPRLSEKLRRYGSSLDQEKRRFVESTMANQWLREQLTFDEEITHDQMLAYYRENLADFEFEAKARWEELSVPFSKFDNNKAAAYRRIAELGNMVVRGAPFAEVARKFSKGLTAEEGGARDWTTRGSLVSETLNQALFTLPVGQLSPIIESETAFHIIRVVERRAAGRTSFEEAQTQIRERLQKDDVNEQIQAHLEKLRKTIRVWTIFDAEDGLPTAERGRLPRG